MKPFKRIVGSVLLIMALSGAALAGDMDTPGASSNSSTFTQVITQILINALTVIP